MLALSPFYEVIALRFQQDSKLSKAIESVSVETDNPQAVRFYVRPGSFGIVKKRSLKIAHLLLKLGNFSQIILSSKGKEDFRFEIEDLITIRPEIAKPMDGKIDRKRKMESQEADARRFRALLEKETERRSAFLLSTSGIYLEVHIKRGVNSKIDPEWMLGKGLDDVVGLKTGFYLLMQIQDAYEAGEVRMIEYEIEYPDETRLYQSELIPVPNTDSVVIFCDRLF